MRWRAKVRPPRLQTAPGCCGAGSQVRAISFQPIWQISIHFSDILCSENSSRKYAYALQSLLEGVRRCRPFLLANLNPLFRHFMFREFEPKIRICPTEPPGRGTQVQTISFGKSQSTFPACCVPRMAQWKISGLSHLLNLANRCQYCNQIACRFDYLHYWQENRLKTANFMPIMQTNAVLRLPDALLASARISAKSFRQSGGGHESALRAF